MKILHILYTIIFTLSPVTIIQKNNFSPTMWSIYKKDPCIEFLINTFKDDDDKSYVKAFGKSYNKNIILLDSSIFHKTNQNIWLDAIRIDKKHIYINQQIWNQLYLKERLAIVCAGFLKSHNLPELNILLNIEKYMGLDLTTGIEEAKNNVRSRNDLNSEKEVVIALGGNAFVKGGKTSYDDQKHTLSKMIKGIGVFVRFGGHPIIVHGNGPQVGTILKNNADISMSDAVEQTQKEMGKMIEESLNEELLKSGIENINIQSITPSKIIVDPQTTTDPTKPIGKWYTKAEKDNILKDNKDWIFQERNDAPNKKLPWRRVVPSPFPLKIIEWEEILNKYQKGIVISGGGGGIPALEEKDKIKRIAGVIDKDQTAALIASMADFKRLIIITAVNRVYLKFNTEQQEPVYLLTPELIREYIDNKEFPKGSMGPKVNATKFFTEKNPDAEAWITGREGFLGTVFDVGQGNGTRIISRKKFDTEIQDILTNYNNFKKMSQASTFTKFFPLLQKIASSKVALNTKQLECIDVFIKRYPKNSILLTLKETILHNSISLRTELKAA